MGKVYKRSTILGTIGLKKEGLFLCSQAARMNKPVPMHLSTEDMLVSIDPSLSRALDGSWSTNAGCDDGRCHVLGLFGNDETGLQLDCQLDTGKFDCSALCR